MREVKVDVPPARLVCYTRPMKKRNGVALAVLLALVPVTASAATKSVAYSAEVITTYNGVTTHQHEWTDGVRWKSQSDDGTSGFYDDPEKRVSWQWGPGYGCLQTSMREGVSAPPAREEPMGRETVDGHPTQKVKVTSTYDDGTGTATHVRYVWRATDLQDVVIQSRSPDGTSETHRRNVVLGPPDPAKLALPSPPCTYDATLDTTRYAAQAAGGYRTIPFLDAGCKQFVPLPLEMSIPSDYALRDARPRGCFWGTEEDLGRVLASPSTVDFSAIHRGVFWCRVSDDTEFDPVHRKFVSQAGPQENWPAAFTALGIQDVVVTPKTVGSIDTLRVSGTLNGKHVYMLYLGFGDSPAVLISYTPPGSGPSSAAEWGRFLESVKATR